MSIDSEVVLQILKRSPQGFTPFEILDYLLIQPQYQGYSRASLFSKLLPELQNLRDSQVVAHVSPRWMLAETVDNTAEELSNDFQEAIRTEGKRNSTELEPIIDEGNSDFPEKLLSDFSIDLLLENLSLRTYRILRRSGILTIKKLQSYSNEDLIAINGFGRKALDEVKFALGNFKPPSQSIVNQEVTLLPEWASIPALKIPTHYLCVSSSLGLLISEYPVVAQLIYAFEAGQISIHPQQNEDLRAALTPFLALVNAPKGYLDWLSSLSYLACIEVLTKYQWTPDKLKEFSRQAILSLIPLDARELTRHAIILGKIPSKPFASIAEEIDYFLDSLNDNQKFVLKQRLGWQSGGLKGLADIGRELELSRERVRQIEQKAIIRLTTINNGIIFTQIRQIAIETLESTGCISTLEDWCEAIAKIYPPGEVHLPSVISWLINFIPEVKDVLISKNKFFYKTPLTKQIFSAIQAQIGEFWQERKISDLSQLHQVIRPLLPEQIINSKKVGDILIYALCYEPIPGIFSAAQWNLGDYAYYVIYEVGKALHFSEIGQRIKQLKPDWKTDDIERSAQGLVERHPDIIRSGSGIYSLREWGTMEYSHFREVLLDYLSKQTLPVDVNQIYSDLNQYYKVTQATVSMNLNLHPNLFNKFGFSSFYGVAGRWYELPDQELVNLLIVKLESEPVSLSELEQDPDFGKYDSKVLYLYLNVSPLFWQIGSFKERKFALSVDGKRQYQAGDGSKIVKDIFNQIREPLHARDLVHLTRNYYAYPPGESAFWRILTEGQDYITVAEAIFIPRGWMSDETLGFLLEDLNIDLFQKIVLFSLSSKRKQPPSDTLFDWLNFCYRNRFFYRGSLIFTQINLSELPEKKAHIARKIGQVCQRNGDISVLSLGKDANSEEIDPTLSLDLEDLRQQAQPGQRALSLGLASIPDGKYRVRYASFGVEVHITKWGGADNPCASVLQVLVNGERYDPSIHNPIPSNTATLNDKKEALKKLYATTLTAYAQVDPYLQVAIGLRPSWGGIGYLKMESLPEPETGDVA